MVPMDLNIGFQALALIQGQIYTPAEPGRLNIHVHPTDYDNQWSQDRENAAEGWMEFWWSRGRIYLPKKIPRVDETNGYFSFNNTIQWFRNPEQPPGM